MIYSLCVLLAKPARSALTRRRWDAEIRLVRINLRKFRSKSVRLNCMLLASLLPSGCGRNESQPASRPSEPITQAESPSTPANVSTRKSYVPKRSNQPSELDALRERATSGDREAQVALGDYFATGRSGRIDLTNAFAWYQASASAGNVRAQYNLATMFAQGLGTDRNPTEAARWFLQAATQGDARAQYDLAMIYSNGQGVAPNPDEANKWLQKSAEQGDGMAQLALAFARAK